MFSIKKMAVVLTVAILAAFSSATFAFADTIGYVNTQKIVFQHPKFEQVQQQIKDMTEKKLEEAKVAVDKQQDDQKKAQEYQKKRQEAAEEEAKLMSPILKDINLAIRTVANAKKIKVVVDEYAVFYGGINLTDDVITQLKKK